MTYVISLSGSGTVRWYGSYLSDDHEYLLLGNEEGNIYVLKDDGSYNWILEQNLFTNIIHKVVSMSTNKEIILAAGET